MNKPLAAQVPFGGSSISTEQRTARPTDRITRFIDDRIRVVRAGNRPPFARQEFDAGVAAPNIRMERMVLVLEPDAAGRQALEALLEAQQDPASPEYHRWLTPETFGERFGASENDVRRVVAWLEGHGFDVEPVAGARRQILFSGTTAQVQAAFHTEIHVYNVSGESHYANASDPEIPEALAEVVSGVVSLHDFRAQPLHQVAAAGGSPLERESGGLLPQFTSGTSHYLAPADFGVIYDVAGLYSQSIDGTGQSIAIAGRSAFNLSDVQTFRSQFGLAANNPTVTLNGNSPGIVSSGEQTEATMDVEWSGAVAKGASIQFVLSASTKTTDGVALSAQYIVNHNVAPIVSVSFGLCEAAMGTAGNQFWNALWQQAAAQGMSVFVASGDNGAAGCDSPLSSQATGGRGVNGLCSSPYSTCVGGTEFADTSNPGAYWLLAAQNSSTYASALSYIPEAVWNTSATVAGGSGLWASGGGASQVYPKPSWQAGPAVSADGWRDVPDVALNASSHDGALMVMNGQLYAVSGTSVAAPSFAGLLALAVQKTGARQGNVNPILYPLAQKQANGGASVFHDVTAGNNGVPGLAGFNAGAGYDLATGLGSVDASVMVNHWSDAVVPTPAFQLGASPAAVSLAPGTSANATVTSSLSGGFSSAIAFSVATLPAGLTASFSPATLAAPGSGSVTLKLGAASALASGSYNLAVSASGGGLSRSLPIVLTVTVVTPPAPAKPAFSLSPSSASFPASGGTGTVTVSASLATASWTATSNANWIAITKGATASGSQTVTYSVAANSGASARSAIMTIAGLTFTVTEAPLSCSYQIAPGPMTSTPQGASASIGVTTAAGCQWTASSNASWLTIASGSSGTGNGSVKFLAAVNNTNSVRIGILMVAGFTIQVTEGPTQTAKH